MDNVINLITYRKIKSLKQNIKELKQVSNILKNCINDLKKFDHYSSVRRRLEDMFVLYQDIERERFKKLEALERLKHEH
jgi:ABC-type uncharacterized transport system fused permease/ATPase subunit